MFVHADGPKLQELRKRTGLNQKQVEERAGLPSGRLTRYERSESVSYRHLEILAAYYSREVQPVSIRDLIESRSLQENLGLITMWANIHGKVLVEADSYSPQPA